MGFIIKATPLSETEGFLIGNEDRKAAFFVFAFDEQVDPRAGPKRVSTISIHSRELVASAGRHHTGSDFTLSCRIGTTNHVRERTDFFIRHRVRFRRVILRPSHSFQSLGLSGYDERGRPPY